MSTCTWGKPPTQEQQPYWGASLPGCQQLTGGKPTVTVNSHRQQSTSSVATLAQGLAGPFSMVKVLPPADTQVCETVRCLLGPHLKKQDWLSRHQAFCRLHCRLLREAVLDYLSPDDHLGGRSTGLHCPRGVVWRPAGDGTGSDGWVAVRSPPDHGAASELPGNRHARLTSMIQKAADMQGKGNA